LITFDPKFSPSPRRDKGRSETGSRVTRGRSEWEKVMAASSGKWLREQSVQSEIRDLWDLFQPQMIANAIPDPPTDHRMVTPAQPLSIYVGLRAKLSWTLVE
jgi:hypothetical protein